MKEAYLNDPAVTLRLLGEQNGISTSRVYAILSRLEVNYRTKKRHLLSKALLSKYTRFV